VNFHSAKQQIKFWEGRQRRPTICIWELMQESDLHVNAFTYHQSSTPETRSFLFMQHQNPTNLFARAARQRVAWAMAEVAEKHKRRPLNANFLTWKNDRAWQKFTNVCAHTLFRDVDANCILYTLHQPKWMSYHPKRVQNLIRKLLKSNNESNITCALILLLILEYYNPYPYTLIAALAKICSLFNPLDIRWKSTSFRQYQSLYCYIAL
jgi:hypothetical protein